jgi:RNA polymerase sigma-70 factor (ECF subfamily)
VLDPEVAADLLAETFAVAYERRRRFRDIGRPGGAWLYGIAAKELSHWFRRQEVERRAVRRLGVQVPPLDDESIARIEALADIDQHREALAAALDQISGGEREAVQLRVVDELGYAEIATRLDCTEGAARRRVHRGLARLNNLMQLEATS